MLPSHFKRDQVDEVHVIRRCHKSELQAIYLVINDAAEAYRGVIPADRWHVPYMSHDQLRHEIQQGVRFWGFEDGGQLVGVMGLQPMQDVALIRHAYIRTDRQRQGIGSALLSHLRAKTDMPLLVGTWADASWAVRFYEKHGFKLVSSGDKERLLRAYWTIPDRQIETSVVLADRKWFARHSDQPKEGDPHTA
jgi:N-acetylglutamate synthase-like GNAT family acetyltransferase